MSLVGQTLEPWKIYSGNPPREVGERARDLVGLALALEAERPD